MKAHLILIPLCIFILISWALFIFIFHLLYEKNFKLENSLDNVHSKVEYFNEIANTLWEERMFEKEMKENLAYYLPESFTSQVRHVDLIPLDLEFGKARVYFIYRDKNYKVDFSYSFDGKKLNIDRASAVEFAQ